MKVYLGYRRTGTMLSCMPGAVVSIGAMGGPNLRTIQRAKSRWTARYDRAYAHTYSMEDYKS